LSKIFLPSAGPSDWQQLLADPDKQWKTGYSARSIAHCWESAEGLPHEVAHLFILSSDFEYRQPELLLAIPEYKVPLPGGSRESQNDVFALVRCADRTVAMTVEGKVNEPFGPTLAEWMANPSEGKRTRLAYLQDLLGLPRDLPDGLHYQLLHRTASAVIEAQRFKTDCAAMIVHSFSQERMWFDAYAQFVSALRVPKTTGELTAVQLPDGIRLYLGWATGDSRFLEA
jgi:hypothetical protein